MAADSPLDSPRLGLFIGAGFSYEAGMPLVWDLTEELLRNWLSGDKLRELNAGWLTQGQGFSEDVLDEFVPVLEDPNLHYEQVIGWLQNRYLERGNPRAEQFHSLHLWLVEMVGHVLTLRHKNNRRYILDGLALYRGLAGLVPPDSPLWIFSLNHDLLVEAIAVSLGMPVCSGFDPTDIISFTGTKGEVSFTRIRKTALASGELCFLDKERGINLLKLHGSLDAFAYTDDLDWIQVVPADDSPSAVIDSPRRIEEELGHEVDGKKVKALNEVVVTDHDGEMQFLRRTLLSGGYKFTGRIGQNAPPEVLEVLRAKLDDVDLLAVIGYGGGDGHINKIFIDWLASDRSRRMEWVSRRGAVPDALGDFANQIRGRAATAVDYLADEGGQPRAPDEELSLRMRAYARHGDRDAKRRAFMEFVRTRLIDMGVTAMQHIPDHPPATEEEIQEWVQEYLRDNGGDAQQLLAAFLATTDDS